VTKDNYSYFNFVCIPS